MLSAPEISRFELGAPYDLGRSFELQNLGPLDPSMRFEPGRVTRAANTPSGPVTLKVTQEEHELVVELHGPGAEQVRPRLRRVLGLEDKFEFLPPEGPVRKLARRHPGLRLVEALGVFDLLVQVILQQRVRWRDAAQSYRQWITAQARPAPGELGLLLPPDAQQIREIPFHELARFGIEEKRARTLKNVARHVARIEALPASGHEEARRLLPLIPGVGPWTTGLLLGYGLADPDAVPLGDLGLPSTVAWALAGEERADDARMLELLEPYRGDRFRVIRLLMAAGVSAPKRGIKRPPGLLPGR